MLREYDDVEPLILSGTLCHARFRRGSGLTKRPFGHDTSVVPFMASSKVGEDEEVSIEEVAKAITKAFGIEGQYKVCRCLIPLEYIPFLLVLLRLVLFPFHSPVRHLPRGRPIPETRHQRQTPEPGRQRLQVHSVRRSVARDRGLVPAELRNCTDGEEVNISSGDYGVFVSTLNFP